MSRYVVEAIHLPQSERSRLVSFESEPDFREFQDRISVTLSLYNIGARESIKIAARSRAAYDDGRLSAGPDGVRAVSEVNNTAAAAGHSGQQSFTAPHAFSRRRAATANRALTMAGGLAHNARRAAITA
jgi:hypothetical protein